MRDASHSPARAPARRFVAVLLALGLALWAAACGTDRGGAPDTGPADLVPADSVAYVEGVLKPDVDYREALLAIAERFPAGERIGARLEIWLDRALAAAAASGGGEPLDFDDDVAPWLGDRFSVAVGAPSAARQRPELVLALETTDPEAAGETLRRALDLSGKRLRFEQAGEVTYAVSERRGTSLGIVGESLVAASSERRFLDTARVVTGDGDVPSLADREAFSYAVGTADGSRALLFAWLDTEPLIETLTAADELPVARAQLEGLAARAGLDLRRPSSFAVGITGNIALFDASLPLAPPAAAPGAGRERRPARVPAPDPAADAELLATLPADALAAAACTSCLEALLTPPTEVPARAAGGSSPTAAPLAISATVAQRARISRLLASVRSSGAFITGPPRRPGKRPPLPVSPTPLGAGLVLEGDRVVIDDLVEAIRDPLESEPGARLSRLPNLGLAARGFRAELPGVPQTLLVAAGERRLVLALGERAAEQGLAAEQTIADSGIFTPLGDQLGNEFEPSSIVNVDAVTRLLRHDALPVAPPGGWPRAYLEPLSRLATGTRIDDGRLLTRLIFAFDGFEG